METSGREVYEFGPFRLDADQQLLFQDGRPVPLTPKAVQTLLCRADSRVIRVLNGHEGCACQFGPIRCKLDLAPAVLDGPRT
jgi:hypothetical protein